jgi:hypothetical protein
MQVYLLFWSRSMHLLALLVMMWAVYFCCTCPDNTAESHWELQIDALISAGFRLSEGITESAISLRGAFDALKSARRSHKLVIKGNEANHREKRRLVCSHTGLGASY